MLPVEIIRRWGVPILGLALLIVGIVLLVVGGAVPADSAAYTIPGEGGTSPQTQVLLGWIMSVLGVILAAAWILFLRARARSAGTE
jgi:protein-S-isoprenylcysteine O-methyltransferase Ste14